MSKAKRKLELGMPFTAMEMDGMGFAVHPGRWTGGEVPDSDCVVIVQERSRGPLGQTNTFTMAIDPEAIPTILDGIGTWLQAFELGSLDRLFDGTSSPSLGRS